MLSKNQFNLGVLTGISLENHHKGNPCFFKFQLNKKSPQS